MFQISPLAFVHPNAKIGDNVTINAFAYIDDNVEIGEGCVIGPHVSIRSGARIGKNNRFYDGCVISALRTSVGKVKILLWKSETTTVSAST